MSAIGNYCKDFQAHVWKKDICANCKRSKDRHEPTPAPSSRTCDSTEVKGSRAPNKATATSAKHTSKDSTQGLSNSVLTKSNEMGKSTLASTTEAGCKREKSIDGLQGSSPSGDTETIELALKTLTAINTTVASSPKCAQRKFTGSRTTMNYSALSNNSNSGNTKSGSGIKTKTTVSNVSSTLNNTTGRAVSNTSVVNNGRRLHTQTSGQTTGRGNAATSRPSIPLDKNVSKFTVNREAAQNAGPLSEKPSVLSKTSGPDKVDKSNNGNKVATKIEKRKCIVDKGRLSTEKVILNDSTVVTTSKQSSDTKKSDKPKRSVFSKKDAIDSSSSGSDKKKSTDVLSAEGAKKPVKSAVGAASKSSESPQKMDSHSTANTASKEKRDHSQTSVYSRSNSGTSVEDGEGKSTIRRSRSRCSRPAAPPPQVPPPGAPASPSKAMAESFHSPKEGCSSDSKRNSATVASGGSFSDLYDDIVNSLSSSKDMSPGLLMKLKDDKPEEKVSHYYHKYDVTGTTKKSRDLTLSSALGEGASSIIIETMNTSFHGSVGGEEVEETTTQELTMPYNIVDVSTVPPPKKSPRLPTTPAPEQSNSRSSTLNKSTLKSRKTTVSSECSVQRSESPKRNIDKSANLKSDIVSMDDGCGESDGALQGLPPRYWHTYEPIESSDDQSNCKKPKNNNVSAKSASVEDILEKCDSDVFVRQSAARATTPARGGKPSESAAPPSVLAHLDLTKPTSKSAENLVESPPADKKINGSKRTGSKKEKQGGFFSRLFGFGRKTSGDEESSEEKSPEGVCSLQENAEFFKPLQVSTDVDSPLKEASLSPLHLDNADIISDIEKAINKKSDQKELRITNENTGTKPKAVLSSTKSDPSDRTEKEKPVASPRSSFLYANTQPIDKPTKTVSMSPESTVDTHAVKKVPISPQGTMDSDYMGQSLSQCSLLSDGSSDAKSISSKEDQGSSGDSQGLRPRRPRPKSQSVTRKMLDAPPPPPPVAASATSAEKRRSLSDDKEGKAAVTKAVTSVKTTSSPTSPTMSSSNGLSLKMSQKGKAKRNSTSEEVFDKKPPSPKKLEISAPIALQSSTLNESQTLPRPVKKVSDNLITESRDDTHMATGRRKKIDSVAKHARNKTVTEGVKFDTDTLRSSPESNGERWKELADQRGSSKFLNRALPPTPSQSQSSKTPERKPRKSVTIQEGEKASYMSMNEDIYTDPIEEEEDILSSASHRKSRYTREALHSSQDKLNRPVFNALKPPVNLLADYLEPTESPETRPSFVKPPVAPKPIYGNGVVKSMPNGAPELLPRTAVTSSTAKENSNGDTYVSMIYVNTEMIIDKTRPPLDVGDGFRCMAFINVETLLHTANTVQTEYIHQDADINDELKFSHFVLKSTKPYVNQGTVAFYNARTYKLKPSDCLLMISAKYINPDLLHHSCVHMLQPSLIFSDRILATYFPDVAKTGNVSSTDPTKSKVYQLGGMVHTNMAVITYHSIQTFESYIKETVHKKIKMNEPYERFICYLLFQILNAILSAHDGSSLYAVKSVTVNDILVVEHPNAKKEPYLVINPLRSADYERLEDELLCNDLIRLVCNLLDIAQLTHGASKNIKGNSRFASGLKKFIDVLEKGSFSCLLVARSIVEYVLWGPSDKEMKSLLLAEDREQAFCIWLEVNRCRYVNELALGQLNRNLELSHMFHFLCAVTGSSLLDVTKLLYKHK